jgi:tripartite-type tricarboxylate transporter receptor subunit TctC
VVPVAAGGGVDTAARILSEKLQERLKQPVAVENRPGAGSMIGANFVAKANPDGHTFQEAIREITGLPDVRARMSTLGMSVDFRNSEQFRDLIGREYQKYGLVVREAGIQPE